MTNRAFLTGLMASVAFILPVAAQTTDIGQINVEGTSETAPGAGYIIPEDSPKERSTVTKAAIDHQPSGANAFQLISRLPGVNSYSTDATGLWGGQMSIRGFDSSEIGVTVAGVPINDSGNYAVYPNELIDAENLTEIDVNQGSPDIDQPQGGAVGGAISLVAEDPTDLFRVKVVQSVGELNFFKSFIRLDTGKIGDSGLKAFISYSKAESDKFKGPGDADKDHIDFGAVYETEQGSRFTVNSFFNSEVDNNYRNINLAQYRQYGALGLDYEPNLPANPFPAGVKGTAQNWNTVPAGTTSAYPGQTYSYANYYKYNQNPFNNEIASFTADIKVMDNLHVVIQPYYWNGFGTGGGQFHTLAEGTTTNAKGVVTPQDLNGDGDTLDTIGFIESSVTSTQRPGVNFKVSYQPLEWNTIKFGLDFDHSRHHQTGPYEPIALDGSFGSAFVDQNLAGRPDGTLYEFRDTTTFNDTKIAFLEDTSSLLNDTLKITAGIKRQEVTREGNNNLPTVYAIAAANPAFADGILHPSADYLSYLPQISANYHITPENSVFANLQKNARAPSNYTLYESAFQVIGSQKQETSWNLDVGYRYQTPDFLASLSLFAVNFQNRQLDVVIPDPQGTASTFVTNINAGSVHNRGVEFETGTAKPLYGFNLYASVAYTKSTIESDLPTANGLLPTFGKNYPNTPKWQISGVVEYLPEILPGSFISLSPKYTSSRYSTLINDEKLKGFVDVDLAAGYRFADGMIDQLHNVSLQFNVQNLLDRDYLFLGYAASSAQVNAQSVKSSTGKIVAGSTPTYYVGAPRFFSVKLSAEFGPVAEAATTTAAYTAPPVVAPALAPKSYLVFFDFNKSDLTPQAVNIVDTAARNAVAGNVTKLEVTGHTDTVGSDAYNMRLSRRRAESVAAQLERDGIPASEIAIFAKGKRDLLIPTADGVKEPQNRRVQIVFDGLAAS